MEDHLLNAVVSSLAYWIRLCEKAAASEDPRAQLLHIGSELRTAHSTLLYFDQNSLAGRREDQKLKLEDIAF